jgi:hypothetical protein
LPIASTEFCAPEDASLLTPARVRAAVHAAGPIQWLGLKVARRPGASTVETIVHDIQAQADLISIEGRHPDIGNAAIAASVT